MIWHNDVLQYANSLVQDKGISYHQASEMLGNMLDEHISSEQLRSAVRRYRKSYGVVPDPCPKSATKFFEAPLTVTSPCFMLMSDLHVPYHNEYMMHRAKDMAERFDVQDIFLLGDTINGDQVSSHNTGGRKTDFNDDLKLVGDVLLWLGEFCKRIIVTNGNHDAWATRKLGGVDLTLSGLIHYGLAGRKTHADLVITERDYVLINNDWVAGHADKYSKTPGKVAVTIAERYKRHVAVGHDHLQGFSSTEDGKYLAVSIGSVVETNDDGESPFWYKERRLNNYQNVANGFMIVKNHVPYLFNKRGLSCLNGDIPWGKI